MSFDQLTPPPKAAKTSDPVRVGVAARGDSPSRLVIMVKAEVLDRIDKKKKRSFTVLLGKGEDRHLLRICADAEGLFQAYELGLVHAGGRFKIILPPHERWPACKVALQPASFEFTGTDPALHVTLPAWAWEAAAKAAVEKRAAGK